MLGQGLSPNQPQDLGLAGRMGSAACGGMWEDREGSGEEEVEGSSGGQAWCQSVSARRCQMSM